MKVIRRDDGQMLLVTPLGFAAINTQADLDAAVAFCKAAVDGSVTLTSDQFNRVAALIKTASSGLESRIEILTAQKFPAIPAAPTGFDVEGTLTADGALTATATAK